MKFIPLAVLILGLAAASRADIQSEIDDCQRLGGGACVYEILREIARTSGGTTLPGCSIRASTFTCIAQKYTDNGCSITCPATSNPVCTNPYCDGGEGYASKCKCG